MKMKHLFAGLVATLALGAATTAGVLASRKESTKPLEEANALSALNLPDVASGKTRYFLDMRGFSDWYSSNATFKLHYWDGSNNVYTKAVKGADQFWYADVTMPNNATGYKFVRFDSSGNTTWNEGAWNTTFTNNYYRPSGWTAGTWSRVYTDWTIYSSTGGSWSDTFTFTDSKLDGDGLQYYSTTVSLTAGQKFKIRSATGNIWLGFNKLGTYNNTSANEKGYLTGEGDGDITVTATAQYEIYVKPYDQSLWAQISSQEEAKAYAQDFIDNMTCSGAGSVTAAAGTWSTYSTRFTNNLTSGARSLLKEASANEGGSTLEQCAARYDEIIIKHGTTEYPDFMDRKPGNASGSRTLNAIPATEAAVPATVAVVGMVSMTAVGGFFFLKKKPF